MTPNWCSVCLVQIISVFIVVPLIHRGNERLSILHVKVLTNWEHCRDPQQIDRLISCGLSDLITEIWKLLLDKMLLSLCWDSGHARWTCVNSRIERGNSLVPRRYNKKEAILVVYEQKKPIFVDLLDLFFFPFLTCYLHQHSFLSGWR